MALITCPECGRENVSDTAQMCPSCGYGIKKHFDILKSEQKAKTIKQRRLDSVQMPSKPSSPGCVQYFFIWIWLVLGLIFFLATQEYMDIAYVYILIGGGLSFFINHIENSN